MGVWNKEAIDRLTDLVVQSLSQLSDEELAYLITKLYEEDWANHLVDDNFKTMVHSLAILGLASFGLSRETG